VNSVAWCETVVSCQAGGGLTASPYILACRKISFLSENLPAKVRNLGLDVGQKFPAVSENCILWAPIFFTHDVAGVKFRMLSKSLEYI